MPMLAEAAELAVILRLKDELTGPLNRIDHSLSGLNTRTATVSGGLSKIGGGLVLGAERTAIAGIAIAGTLTTIGLKAADAAKAYDAAMEQLRTQTGASQAEVESMKAAVLSMASSVGTAPDVLAAGLYHVESAGKRGAEALDILRTAALGAKLGNSDLEETVNALVGAEQSGIKGAETMGTAMGTLNAIVGSGNMRMQDLVDAFASGIAAAGKTFGVSLQSIGAALATMSDEGIPAADAATRLRMTLSLLGAPSAAAAKELGAIGIGSLDMANAMRGPGGLVDAIGLLRDHMQKAGLIDASGNPNSKGAQLLSNAFGGGRSSAAIMTLVGNFGLLEQKQAAVNKGAKDFNDSVSAMQDTVAYKSQVVNAKFEALKVTLGEKLLPVEGRVYDGFAKFLDSPEITRGIDQLGNAIDSLFSQQNIDAAAQFAEKTLPELGLFATSVLPPLVGGLKEAGAVAKTAFDMFNQLPTPVKEAVIAALAANKLSGGLIASGIGDLAKIGMGAATGAAGGGGGIAGILGVQKVFVVNMPAGGLGGGGLPGLGGAAAAGAGGLTLEGMALPAAGTAVGEGVTLGAAVASLTPLIPMIAGAGALAVVGLNAPSGIFGGKPISNENLLPTMVASNPMFNQGSVNPITGEKYGYGPKGAIPVTVTNQPTGPGTLPARPGDMIAASKAAGYGARPGDAIAAGKAPAELVKLSKDQIAAINRSANLARDDIHRQIAGQLDSKKAITDGLNLVKVYTSGTAEATRGMKGAMDWAGRNIEMLKALQQRFKDEAAAAAQRGDAVTARSDAATAAALGGNIAALQTELRNKQLSTNVSVNVEVSTAVSIRDMNIARNTASSYGVHLARVE